MGSEIEHLRSIIRNAVRQHHRDHPHSVFDWGYCNLLQHNHSHLHRVQIKENKYQGMWTSAFHSFKIVRFSLSTSLWPFCSTFLIFSNSSVAFDFTPQFFFECLTSSLHPSMWSATYLIRFTEINSRFYSLFDQKNQDIKVCWYIHFIATKLCGFESEDFALIHYFNFL